jgi:cobalt-zinc-cadmium efflux system outer membrane protein
VSHRLVAIGAVLATATVANAVAHADPAKSVTVDQAVSLALTHNPDAASADDDVAAAEGAVDQARAFENPSLFIGALGKNLSPFDAPTPNQFGVTWTLPLGGKRAAGIATARADLRGAEASRIDAHRQLAGQVETTFVAIQRDAAQLDFARQDQADLAEALELDQVRYKDGKIAYNDVLKLTLQARTADDNVRQAELQLATDRAELSRLCGEGALADDFTIVGELVAPKVDDVSADALLQRALTARGDYRALQAGEASAASAVVAARRTPIPDLGILLDYDRVPDGAGAIDLSLTVSLPLFDRNHGAIKQAEAARRKAAHATESLRLQLRADAQDAVASWKTAKARLDLYDGELLKAAKESLDISEHAYQQGRGSLLDYLDAEASYRETEAAYLDAVAGAVLAAIQLRYVAGEDIR